jgi:hypothetical protein
MKGKQEPVEVRFWRFVDMTGECWLWTGAKSGPNGYGKIGIDGTRTRSAHRVSFELSFGPIPKGLWVLHSCDNPSCVNPTHLYLGDRAQNMRDAHERCRIDMKRVASFQKHPTPK